MLGEVTRCDVCCVPWPSSETNQKLSVQPEVRKATWPRCGHFGRSSSRGPSLVLGLRGLEDLHLDLGPDHWHEGWFFLFFSILVLVSHSSCDITSVVDCS